MKLTPFACHEDPSSSLKPLQKQQFVMTLSCFLGGGILCFLASQVSRYFCVALISVMIDSFVNKT